MKSSIKHLYSRAKLFYKIQAYKNTGKKKPILSILLLTSKCNMSCVYCFAPHKGRQKELSTDDWKHIITELRKRGAEVFFLMGGEPLLRDDLEELVDFIHEIGAQCHLTTNCLLARKNLNILKKVDVVMASLDGDEQGHDANRGKGTFKLVTKGIQLMQDNGIIVRVNCVVTKNNIDSAKWLLEYGKRNNIWINFSVPAECESLLESGVALSDHEIREFYRQLKAWKHQGFPLQSSDIGLDYIIDYPLSFNEIIFKGNKLCNYYPKECLCGRIMIYVDSEGNIYPCATLWEQLQLFQPKNIFKDGFDEALINVQELPCWACYCAGNPEWDYFSSFRGIPHALKFTLKQLVGK